MGKLLPLILALVGLAAGVGAGIALKPDSAAKEDAHHETEGDGHGSAEPAPAKSAAAPKGHGSGHGGEAATASEFVKMNNQFVVPVLSDGGISAMVVMSLSVEVVAGAKEAVFQREPRLRDAILRQLFDHSNSGGFDGAFFSSQSLDRLRAAMRETAISTVGPVVLDILIVDLVKQNV